MKPQHVVVDGKRVAYRAAGAGPTVVIIAGLGLSSRFYEPNIIGIAQYGVRVVVPDLPGFGATRGKLAGLTIAQAADFVLRFADALEIQRAVFVGHSVGCQVALLIAARNPERTSGIVLTGPTGGGVRRQLHQLFSLARVAVHEGMRVLGAVARDYIRTTPFHYVGWWIKAARDRPLDHAARVRAPALILIGDKDPVPTAAFIAALEERLAHARVERFEDTYHALPLERPESFNRVVSGFVLCGTKSMR